MIIDATKVTHTTAKIILKVRQLYKPEHLVQLSAQGSLCQLLGHQYIRLSSSDQDLKQTNFRTTFTEHLMFQTI
jgi:hypothetical protein